MTITQETFDKITEHLSNGFSLRAACADVGINPRFFYSFMAKDEEYRKQYAYACDVRAEMMASAVHEIAETEPDVQRARVRIDAIKWEAGKLKPKKYGDSIDVTSKGERINIVSALVPGEKSPDEWGK